MRKTSGNKNPILSCSLFLLHLVQNWTGCHGLSESQVSTSSWSLYWTINGIEHCWVPENLFLYPGTSIKPIPAADCCDIMRYHPHPVYQSNWMETITTTGLCFSTKQETTLHGNLIVTLDEDCSTHSFHGRNDGKMALTEKPDYCMDFKDGYNILSECSKTRYLPDGKDCSSKNLLVSYRVSIPIKPSKFIRGSYSIFHYMDRMISVASSTINTTSATIKHSNMANHTSIKKLQTTSQPFSTNVRYRDHSFITRQKSNNIISLIHKDDSPTAITKQSGRSVSYQPSTTTKTQTTDQIMLHSITQQKLKSSPSTHENQFTKMSEFENFTENSNFVSFTQRMQNPQQSQKAKHLTRSIHKSKSTNSTQLYKQIVYSQSTNSFPVQTNTPVFTSTVHNKEQRKTIATSIETISQPEYTLINESTENYIRLNPSSKLYFEQSSNTPTLIVSSQYSDPTSSLLTKKGLKVFGSITKAQHNLQYTSRKQNQSELSLHLSISTTATTNRKKEIHSSVLLKHSYSTTKKQQLKSVTEIDANLSQWAPWSNCLTSCEEGVQERFRQNCTKLKPCDRLEKEIKSCFLQPCPVNGGLSQWSNWSVCSKSCEQGYMVRKRSCTQPTPKFGGEDCLGVVEEKEICNTHLCPIDGGWTTWSPYTKCNKPCNIGRIIRTRFCTNPTPANNGKECEGVKSQIKLCHKRICYGLTSKLVLSLDQNEWGISNNHISTEKHTKIKDSVTQNIEEFYNFANIYSNDSNVAVLQDVQVDKISYSNSSIEVSVYLEFTALDSGQLILLVDEMERYQQIEKLSVLDFNVSTQYVPQGKPHNLTGYSLSRTEIFIKWEVPEKQRNLTYVVFIKKREESSLNYNSIGTDCCNATIIGLQPSQRYWLRVLAYNPHGNGIPSNHIEIQTTMGAPSLPPHNIDVTTQGTSIFMEWDIDPSEVDLVSGYTLQIKKTGSDFSWEYTTVHRQFFLEGMKPSTSYIIDICAFTSFTCGPKARVTTKTKASGPTMSPLNIMAVPVLGEGSLLIRWQHIPNDEVNGVLLHYVISYKRFSPQSDITDHPTLTINVSSRVNSTKISSLETYQTYQIKMWGVNQYGFGEKSKSIIASTDKCPTQINTNYVNLHPYICIGERYQCLFEELIRNFTGEICSYDLSRNKNLLNTITNGKGGWATKSDILLMKADLNHDVDLSFPVNANKEVLYYAQGHFIPIIEHPGVVVITAKEETEQVIKRMLSAIVGCWPILAFNVLLIISSGIIMWFIESGQNNEDFPQPFVQGVLNGMWWSFVTSVTLGYGDKCPKTFQGRLFGIVWTIIGIITVATLTGLLTSSLNAYNVKTSFSIYGKKVGALSGSIGYKIAVRRNAKVNEDHQYLTISELIEALEAKQVEHILVDAFTAKSNRKVLTHHSFLVSKVIEERSMYGFVASSRLGRFSSMLREYVKSNQGAVYRALEAYSTPIKVYQETTQVVSLFNNEISSFKMSIQVMGLTLLIAIMFGVISYLQRRRQVQKIDPRISISKLKLYNDLIELHKEINSTKATLEAGINKIVNDYMQYGKVPIRHKNVSLNQNDMNQFMGVQNKVKMNKDNNQSMTIEIPDEFFLLSRQVKTEWDTVPKWFLMNKYDMKKNGYD